MPYYLHFEFYKSIVVQSQKGVKKIIKNIPKNMHSLHRLLINAALFGTKLTFLTKCHFILYLFKRIFLVIHKRIYTNFLSLLLFILILTLQ